MNGAHGMPLDAAGSVRRLPSDAVDACQRWLQTGVEILGASALVAEVVILMTGIVARTVFRHPLVWSDELASILFLWLAMLGAALAVQKNTHMRLTFFIAKLPPRARVWSETLAVGTMLALLALVLYCSYDYVDDQGFVVTPALGWSGMVRALALPVGFAAALASCVLRLLAHGKRDVLGVAIVLALIAAGCYLAAPELAAMGQRALPIFFLGMLGVAVAAGVPIAFAFAISTSAYLLSATSVPLVIVVGRMDEGMSSLILLAVPMFVLLGQLVHATGMARVMVEFLASLVGHVRGGMSYVLLGAMLLVSGISGSKTADMAAVAPVLFPEMRRRGVPDSELISLLAASGAMSETIPPSLVLIAIASVTSISIASLFTAGILPAIVLALVLAVMAWWRAGSGHVRTSRASSRQILRTLLVASPALLLPFVIRSAVVEGVATATEVSTIGIFYSLAAGLLIYRGRLTWRMAMPILTQTVALSGAILFIVGAASAMSWALTQSGFSQNLAAMMVQVPGGEAGFLLISIAAFVVLGSVLEGIPAIVLFAPLLFPIAHRLGINEIHYAMVVILAMGLGTFAPPFGLCYYAACIIGEVPPEAALRRIWLYLGVLLAGLIAITFIPSISTCLL